MATNPLKFITKKENRPWLYVTLAALGLIVIFFLLGRPRSAGTAVAASPTGPSEALQAAQLDAQLQAASINASLQAAQLDAQANVQAAQLSANTEVAAIQAQLQAVGIQAEADDARSAREQQVALETLNAQVEVNRTDAELRAVEIAAQSQLAAYEIETMAVIEQAELQADIARDALYADTIIAQQNAIVAAEANRLNAEIALGAQETQQNADIVAGNVAAAEIIAGTEVALAEINLAAFEAEQQTVQRAIGRAKRRHVASIVGGSDRGGALEAFAGSAGGAIGAIGGLF